MGRLGFGELSAGAETTVPQAFHPQGTAALPGITFENDGDSGLFRQAANVLAITVNGLEQWRVSDAVLGFQRSTTVRADTGTLTINAFTLGGGLTLNGQTLSGNAVLSGIIDVTGSIQVPRKANPASPVVGEVWINASSSLLRYRDNAATPANRVLVAEDLTQTLTGKTLSSPTLSGTVAGTPTFSDVVTFNPTSTSPAVTINQLGTGRLWDFQDGGTSVFYALDGGDIVFTAARRVGIGILTPTAELHIRRDVGNELLILERTATVGWSFSAPGNAPEIIGKGGAVTLGTSGQDGTGAGRPLTLLTAVGSNGPGGDITISPGNAAGGNNNGGRNTLSTGSLTGTGLKPLVEIDGRGSVPTTAVLNSGYAGLKYNAGGTLVFYVNDGGIIKSLSLGTPA